MDTESSGMPAPKRRKFVYKVANLLKSPGDPKVTLESLLLAARKKVPTALARCENPAGSDVEKRFINYSLTHTGRDGNGSIYGSEFLAFEEGEGQSTIRIDATAAEVSLASITAGKDKEFLAGSVYFGVLGNHVVVCQSRGLKVKELEDYLNWFLVSKAKVLAEDNRVTLCDHIPKAARSLFKGVKGIEFKSPIQLQPSPEIEKMAAADKKAADEARAGRKKGTPKSEAETRSHFYPVQLAGKAWEAVKTLVGDSFDLPNEITVDNLANTPEIEVQIFLKWKGRHSETDSDFLDGVASNLRHIDEEVDYEVQGDAGSMGRDQIKIFKTFSVNWTKEGRPKFDELFPKMAEWLADLVRDGRVDP
jgi:hypothetical protein